MFAISIEGSAAYWEGLASTQAPLLSWPVVSSLASCPLSLSALPCVKQVQGHLCDTDILLQSKVFYWERTPYSVWKMEFNHSLAPLYKSKVWTQMNPEIGQCSVLPRSQSLLNHPLWQQEREFLERDWNTFNPIFKTRIPSSPSFETSLLPFFLKLNVNFVHHVLKGEASPCNSKKHEL